MECLPDLKRTFRPETKKKKRSHDIFASTPGLLVRFRMHPPFDDAAKARAKQFASAAGKPDTRAAGLLAIHSVLHRQRFSKDEDCWTHYGSKKQRFYEWKALVQAASKIAAGVPHELVEVRTVATSQATSLETMLEEAQQQEQATKVSAEEQERCELARFEQLTIRYCVKQLVDYVRASHDYDSRRKLGVLPSRSCPALFALHVHELKCT